MGLIEKNTISPFLLPKNIVYDIIKNMSENKKEIRDVQIILNELIPLTEEAEQKFSSARNWGFFDILGGGLITDIIKHTKLSSASDLMNRINILLQHLQRELAQVIIPTDFRMEMGTFSTFADFVFDGMLADIYMQSKIMSSLDQVRELKRRLYILKENMNRLESRY